MIFESLKLICTFAHPKSAHQYSSGTIGSFLLVDMIIIVWKVFTTVMRLIFSIMSCSYDFMSLT